MTRRSIAAAALVLLAACTGESADDADEDLSVARQEFAEEGIETIVSDSVALDAFDPSMAWIRTQDTSQQTFGTMLTAFTWYQPPVSTAAVHVAGWSYSRLSWADDSPTVPTWVERNANTFSSGAFAWPRPENICDVYGASETSCGGSGMTWNTSTLLHWQRPAAALWTGLDDVAAIVTTGRGLNGGNEEAVFMVASADGGQTFTRSHILSVKAQNGTPTGGPWTSTNSSGIVPGSVHASLGYFGERTSLFAGEVSVPIYVTWQSNGAGGTYGESWWWTRVVVGKGGEIAITTPPRALNFVPTGPGTKVSIFGYQIGGEERVGVAWVDRSDASAPTDCVSNLTPVTASWYVSSSADLGESWGCFTGNEQVAPGSYYDCDIANGRTLIASDASYVPCVTGGGNAAHLNVRPEVAISAPAIDEESLEENDLRKFFYFGINHDLAVVVYRTGGAPFVNPDYDRLLTIAQTTGSINPHAHALSVRQTVDEPRLQVAFRDCTSSLRTNFRPRTMQVNHEEDPYTVLATLYVLTGSSSNRSQGYWGRHSGIAVFEKCDDVVSSCLPYPGDIGDDEFGVAWTSTQNSLTTRSEVYTQSFEWQ